MSSIFTPPHGIVKSKDETRYYKNGVIHREDGPAIEYTDGGSHWMINGTYHRLDGGPAIDIPNHCKRWFQWGVPHREGGPAEIWESKNHKFNIHRTTEKWFFNGKLHRENGPAESCFDEIKQKYIQQIWFRNGQLHREDGPATLIYHLNEDYISISFALNDVVLNCKTYTEFFRLKKLLAFK